MTFPMMTSSISSMGTRDRSTAARIAIAPSCGALGDAARMRQVDRDVVAVDLDPRDQLGRIRPRVGHVDRHTVELHRGTVVMNAVGGEHAIERLGLSLHDLVVSNQLAVRAGLLPVG